MDTVRRATHADCTGIKNIIRDLYDGSDKFVFNFHKDLNSGTTFPYVAEIAGEIVAYTCGQVIEDGELMKTREARVSEKYQGRSITKKVNAALIQAALAKFPNLQRITWTSGSRTAVKQGIERHPFIKQVFHGCLEKCRINTSTLKALSETENFHQLEKKYSIEDITTVPKREALRLLTEEIRFLDYAPIRPIIGWQPSGWHRSTIAAELQITDLFIIRSSSVNEIEAFSFFTVSRSGKGPCFEVITYCAPGERSTDFVIAHMLNGLREIVTLYTQELHVYCTFFFPAHVDRSAILKLLNVQLGIPTYVKENIAANMLEYRISDLAASVRSKI